MEIFANSIIVRNTKISNKITIIRAKVIFCNPKKIGDQAKLINNWEKNKIYPLVLLLYAKLRAYKNKAIPIDIYNIVHTGVKK